MPKEKVILTRTDKKTVLLLLLMTGATCLLVFHQYLFGNKILAFGTALLDCGTDTVQQYLPQYASIIGKLRSGDFSLWDLNNGFGASLYMYNMFNPLLDVLYLIGWMFGFSVIPYCLVYLMIAEIIGSALLGYLYLSVFNLDERAKALAAYMYGFNGFLIIWGQHYQFGVICLLLPLFLWTAERCIRKRECWKALAAVTAVLVMNSMYFAYMTLLFAALYVMIRFLMREKFRFSSWFLHSLTLALPMLLGIMIGGISLLPSYAAISNVSARVSSSGSLLSRLAASGTRYAPSYYTTLLKRFFSGTGEGITAFSGYLNYYEAPCVFFSGLFIILFLQYLFLIPSERRSLKNKVIQYGLAATAAVTMLFPVFGTILNGFTAPFSRYTFLYMPYFMLISAFTLHRILTEKKISWIALLASAVLSAAVYVSMIVSPASNPKMTMKLLLAAVIGMSVCLAFAAKAKKEGLSRAAFLLLALLLLADAGADTYSSFSKRSTMEKNDSFFTGLSDPDVLNALAYLKKTDSGFYRIEKTFGMTLCMDSMLYGYHPVSTYNSTQNRNIIVYADKFWPALRYRDANHYSFALGARNEAQASLTGVKYVLAKRKNMDLPGYEIMTNFGDVWVYKSTSAESIASFYREGSYTYADGSSTVNFADRDKEAKISLADPQKSDTITGTVTVQEDGLLFIAIPFEAGWKAYVDGRETAMTAAENGFLSLKMKAGSHSLLLTYNCPLLHAGMVSTGCGILLFAVLAGGQKILEKKRRRKAIHHVVV